jgi:hypothetical protein
LLHAERLAGTGRTKRGNRQRLFSLGVIPIAAQQALQRPQAFDFRPLDGEQLAELQIGRLLQLRQSV